MFYSAGIYKNEEVLFLIHWHLRKWRSCVVFYSVGIHINEEVMLCFYSVCICMNEVLVF